MLSKRTQYALSVLFYLADKNPDEYVTVDEMTREIDLSKYYLAKIIGSLSEHRHLETKKGRRGGVKLAVNPEEFSLYRLLEDLDEFPELVQTANSEGDWNRRYRDFMEDLTARLKDRMSTPISLKSRNGHQS